MNKTIHENQKIQTAIIGVTGYTGIELLRLIHSHPYFEIKYCVSQNKVNEPLGKFYQHLPIHLQNLVIQSIHDINWKEIGLVFFALPHNISQTLVENVPNHCRIIDLAADFRMKDLMRYEEYYGISHTQPEFCKKFTYGLTEVFRNEIAKSNYIACPGCYPTSILLPLYPLMKDNLVKKDNIIIDSKSGMTGAGRGNKIDNLFAEIHGSISAYGISTHRHIAEMEELLSFATNDSIELQFTPHKIPANRGILSNIYLTLEDNVSIEFVSNYLAEYYTNEEFVIYTNSPPGTYEVNGTNYCKFTISPGRHKNKIVITSVIDNLLKGAAGQAIQNANLIFGFNEVTGLEAIPLFP